MSKNFIKTHLDKTNGYHTLRQFDEISELIFKNMQYDDYDQRKIKKTMARYSQIKNGKICFDTSKQSGMNYKDLKDNIETNTKKPFDFCLKANSNDSRYFQEISAGNFSTTTKIWDCKKNTPVV